MFGNIFTYFILSVGAIPSIKERDMANIYRLATFEQFTLYDSLDNICGFLRMVATNIEIHSMYTTKRRCDWGWGLSWVRDFE